MTKTQIELMKFRDRAHHWNYFADSPEDVPTDDVIDVVEEYYEVVHPGPRQALAVNQ